MDINPQQKERTVSTITASIRVFNAAPEVADALKAALLAAAGTIDLDASIRVEATDTDPETGGKRQITTTDKVFAIGPDLTVDDLDFEATVDDLDFEAEDEDS